MRTQHFEYCNSFMSYKSNVYKMCTKYTLEGDISPFVGLWVCGFAGELESLMFLEWAHVFQEYLKYPISILFPDQNKNNLPFVCLQNSTFVNMNFVSALVYR